MTISEAKAIIASKVAQYAVNVLIDQLAETQLERDALKARIADLEQKPSPTRVEGEHGPGA